MSANVLSKALNHAGAVPALAKSISVHAELRGPSDPQLGRRNWSLVGRSLPASASPRAALPNAILIAALSLSLAGCGVLQPATTARTTPPPQTDTKGAQQLALPTKPPEAPTRPAPPVPQSAPRVSETKPPSVTAARGAEKLVAPNPAAPVRVSERTTLSPAPSAPKTPVAEDSVTVTGAPVQALIFRGPPPQARPRRAGIIVLVSLGLGLGGAALAVLARLYVIRRAKPAVLLAAGKDELKMPRELLFKEPLNLPQEPAVVPEKS
ncbi:MAG: hypothetical protein ABSD29_18435 [Verrucomicrobiota bacterium]